MALAAEGVRARIYSCRKAFRLNWALAPAAPVSLTKKAFFRTLWSRVHCVKPGYFQAIRLKNKL